MFALTFEEETFTAVFSLKSTLVLVCVGVSEGPKKGSTLSTAFE